MTSFHENSLNAYIDVRDDGSLNNRRLRVLGFIQCNNNCTARDVMVGLGYTDLNMVRPRITELKNDGIIYESGKVKDYITKKKVSTFRLSYNVK